jgi:6-phosphogluconolactonase
MINELQPVVSAIFSQIRAIIAEQGKVTLALSGGSSVKNIYGAIVNYADELDNKHWSKVTFVLADERLVPIDSIESNSGMIKELLIEPLIHDSKITSSQFLAVDNQNRDKAAIHYSVLIENIDIAILGVGEDGHIASLFPLSDELDQFEPQYLYVEDSPKPPPKRITMSPMMVQNCKSVFLLFFEERKRAALQEFSDKKIDYKHCPAKIAIESDKCYLVTNLV